MGMIVVERRERTLLSFSVIRRIERPKNLTELLYYLCV